MTEKRQKARAAGVAVREAVERTLTSKWWTVEHGNFVTYGHQAGWHIVIGLDTDGGYLRISEPGDTTWRYAAFAPDDVRQYLADLRVPDSGGAA